jgi:hypothetical protein
MSVRIIFKNVSLLALVVATGVLVFAASPASATVPYVNELVSRDSSGNIGIGGGVNSGTPVSSSADGRYVAFASGATNLVPGDTNGKQDVFVRDRKSGTTARVSLNYSGSQVSDPGISGYKISANGRFVVFSGKTYYFEGGGSYSFGYSVYIRDLLNNTTELISKTSAGAPVEGQGPDISADGRYVVYYSSSSNVVSGDTNGVSDIFLYDRKSDTTTLLSKSDTGTLGNASVSYPSISCDGAYIAFNTNATNLVSDDTNGYADTFLVDRINNTIKDLTINGNDSSSYSDTPQISCDGSTIVFGSSANNLITGDTNSLYDLFAYDTYSESFERLNVTSNGVQTTDYGLYSGQGAYSVSFNGQYVAFGALSAQLVPGDTNAKVDIFVRDRAGGTTQRLSMRDSSTETAYNSVDPWISADARIVTYISGDNGLVSGDTNGYSDAFTSETGF